MLALAALGSAAASATDAGRPIKIRPPAGFDRLPNILRSLPSGPPPASQRPPYNQRKARKARRARYAAGDRQAFRRS